MSVPPRDLNSPGCTGCSGTGAGGRGLSGGNAGGGLSGNGGFSMGLVYVTRLVGDPGLSGTGCSRTCSRLLDLSMVAGALSMVGGALNLLGGPLLGGGYRLPWRSR